MKKILFLTTIAFLNGSLIFAEPLKLQQADQTVGKGVLEAGINDASYQKDEVKITNSAGATQLELTTTANAVPLFLRYGITSKLEGFISIPFVSEKTEIIVSGLKTEDDESGLGDPSAGLKMTLIDRPWKFGAGITADIPAGDKDFREGFNINPFLALRRSFLPFTLNTNLGYTVTNEYEEDATSIDRDPGDILTAGIGIEIPFLSLNGFSIITEYVYQNLSKSKTAGVSQNGSSGTISDVLAGFRYNVRNLKTKLGCALSVGDEKYRPYDYKIIAAVTYLFDL